ncbi:MAG: adenylosuccinate lyase [Flavobacteriaceae bacterium]|tara:strand:- start:47 stop:1396 length:1350 start_codon:yes stop_codon:yes gene_type:complete
MKINSLNAISPIDGRYRKKTESLSKYFSEESLIKYRLKIEIEYFIALCKIPLPELKNFNSKLFKNLRNIYINFSKNDAIKIKKIERKTNHDVKAVEYYIKEKFNDLNILEYNEFVHFGLTSQDINNTAIPLSLKEALNNIYLIELNKIIEFLKKLVNKYNDITILARTHGQPASPTTMGKELDVFNQRLIIQRDQLLKIPNSAKFSGATGNFNAHNIAYPKINWKKFAENFVNITLGLNFSFPTTQIEHYDSFASLCDNLKRINTILIDFNQDIWLYISQDYFKQKVKSNEVGSSAMPHKVNPIDFENAEGNLGIANSILNFFSSKLPISRLQRDLTDSTVLRNIGVPIGHTLIAFSSILNGLKKIVINQEKIKNDLEDNWVVISEAIQTILRREGYNNPYEVLKDLTRKDKTINKKNLHSFINKLDISEELKIELKKISPYNYIGILK